MRKAIKFLHTLGTVGMLGALAALMVLYTLLPPATDLSAYAQMRVAMGRIAEWMLLPSLATVLVSGLLAMAFGSGFHSAGWAWMKLATGVVVFEGTLFSVQGPAQREADRVRQALAGEFPVSELALTIASEWYSLWVIAGLALANIVLGIWRPRFKRRRESISGSVGS